MGEMMSTSVLQPFVNKLLHPLYEVRIRALKNINSKLLTGIITETDLINNCNLIKALLNWLSNTENEDYNVAVNILKKISAFCNGRRTIKICGGLKILENIIKTTTDQEIKTECKNIMKNIEETSSQRESFSESIEYLPQEIFPQNLETHKDSQCYNSLKKSSHIPEHFLEENIKEGDLSKANNTYFENETFEKISFQQIIFLSGFPNLRISCNDRNNFIYIEKLIKTNSDSDFINLSENLINRINSIPAEFFLQDTTILFAFLDNIPVAKNIETKKIMTNCIHYIIKALNNQIGFLCSIFDLSSKGTIEPEHFKSNDSGIENNKISINIFCEIVLQKFLYLIKLEGNRSVLKEYFLTIKSVIEILRIFMPANYWLQFKSTQKMVHSIIQALTESIKFYHTMYLESELVEINFYRIVYINLLDIFVSFLHCCLKLENLNEHSSMIVPTLKKSVYDMTLLYSHKEIHRKLLNYLNTLDGKSAEYFECSKNISYSLKNLAKIVKQEKPISISKLISASKTLAVIKSKELFFKYLHACLQIQEDPSDENVNDSKFILFLKLLSSQCHEIRMYTYSFLHQIVQHVLGLEKRNKKLFNFNDLDIIIHEDILTEIVTFGLTKGNTKDISCEILLYLLKCEKLVTKDQWKNILFSLKKVLHIIQCFTENELLNKTCLCLLEPNLSECRIKGLNHLETLTGNIRYMFSSNENIRRQALERIIWLINRQDSSHQFTPHFTDIIYSHDKNLLVNTFKVKLEKKVASTNVRQNFKQLKPLNEILQELRTSSGSEKKKAFQNFLTMIENISLQKEFVDLGIFEFLMNELFSQMMVMNKTEEDVFIPEVIESFKIFFLDNIEHIKRFSGNESFLLVLLRCAFRYSDSKNIKINITVLLALLMFWPEIKLIEGKFLVNYVIFNNIVLPFTVKTFGKESLYSDPEDVLLENLKNNSFFQHFKITWNLSWFGGMASIISFDEEPLHYQHFIKEFQLSQRDLEIIKGSFPISNIEKYLIRVYNATNHSDVNTAIEFLAFYTSIENRNEDYYESLSLHALIKFLEVIPSSKDDKNVFVNVIELLTLIIRSCKDISSLYRPTLEWLVEFKTSPDKNLAKLIEIQMESFFNVEEVIFLTGSQEKKVFELIQTLSVKVENSLSNKTGSTLKFAIVSLDEAVDIENYPLTKLIKIIYWIHNYLFIPKSMEQLSSYECISLLTHLTNIIKANVSKNDFESDQTVILSVSIMIQFLMNKENCKGLLVDIIKNINGFKWLDLALSNTNIKIKFTTLQIINILIQEFKTSQIDAYQLKMELDNMTKKIINLVSDSEVPSIIKKEAISIIMNIIKKTENKCEEIKNNISRKVYLLDAANYKLIDSNFIKTLSVTIENYLLQSHTFQMNEIDGKFSIEIMGFSNSSNKLFSPVSSCLVQSIAKLLKNMLLSDTLQFISENSALFQNMFKILYVVERSKNCGDAIIMMCSAILNTLTSTVITNSVIANELITDERSLFSTLLLLIRLLNQGQNDYFLNLVKSFFEFVTALLYVLKEVAFKTVVKLLDTNWNDISYILLQMLRSSDTNISVASEFIHGVCASYNIFASDSSSSINQFLDECPNINKQEEEQNCTLVSSICHLTMKCFLDDIPKFSFLDSELLIVKTMCEVSLISKHVQKYASQNGLIKKIIKHLTLISNNKFENILKSSDGNIETIILPINLLQNIVYQNVSGKMEIAKSNLNYILLKLWSACQSTEHSFEQILNLLATLTSDCVEVCETLSSMYVVQKCDKINKTSVLQNLIKMLQFSILNCEDSNSFDNDSKIFIILTTASRSFNCRITLYKSNILKIYFSNNFRKLKKSKYFEILFLDLLISLSCFKDGQSYIGKLDDVESTLLASSKYWSDTLKLASFSLIRNLCFLSINRTKFLKQESFIILLKKSIMSKKSTTVQLSLSTIKIIASNNPKIKHFLKESNIENVIINSMNKSYNPEIENLKKQTLNILNV